MTRTRTIRQQVVSGLIAAALVILIGAGPTLNMTGDPFGAGLMLVKE